MKLLDNKTCCGCGACIAACKKNCIHFTTDNHLQKFPVIDNSKCIECGLCRKVCPIISPRVSASRDTNAYIAFSQTPATLAASSSGGVMKELERGVMEFRGGGGARERHILKITNLQDTKSHGRKRNVNVSGVQNTCKAIWKEYTER